MSASQRIALTAGVVGFGLVLVGVGVFFGVVGLEDADRWGSVLSLFLTAVGLGVSVYGVILARRSMRAPQGGGQRVSDVAGDNYQFGRVEGGVRIGRRTGRPQPPARRNTQNTPGPSGGQPDTGGQVAGRVGGDNAQFGSVGQDVEIERD
ncbi:hypothetical protein [Actinomadura formosensis]|uniref:hypothetical protein n=1 Tax=Actinomadura formosensis TaxID=60706 RepID=UPI003D942869